MLEQFVHALVRPFAREWVSSSSQSWRSLVVPEGAALAHAAGSDPDRIMLMGHGLVVSYGVLSHDLGLAGHLARRLTVLTGRGTTVDVRAHPDMTTAEAIEICSTSEIAMYDAVVVMLGGTNAVFLGAPKDWADEISTLIETLRRHAPLTRMLFIGIPIPTAFVRMPALLRFFVESHIRRLNRVGAELCEKSPSATFIPFEPEPVRVLDRIGRENYRRWADQIADAIAESLNLQRHHRPIEADEEARLEALRAMNVLHTSRDSDLDQMVSTTWQLFGAAGAGITLIDSSRQWVIASAGRGPQNIPRSESVCNITITAPDIFIVEDTHLHPDYREKEWAHGAYPVRFYAGYPIETPDGHRIGALCVLDNKPRTFSSSDRALLRELALQVQNLLWKKHSGLSRGDVG